MSAVLFVPCKMTTLIKQLISVSSSCGLLRQLLLCMPDLILVNLLTRRKQKIWGVGGGAGCYWNDTAFRFLKTVFKKVEVQITTMTIVCVIFFLWEVSWSSFNICILLSRKGWIVDIGGRDDVSHWYSTCGSVLKMELKNGTLAVSGGTSMLLLCSLVDDPWSKPSTFWHCN